MRSPKSLLSTNDLQLFSSMIYSVHKLIIVLVCAAAPFSEEDTNKRQGESGGGDEGGIPE